jgi:hypothetical protein
MVTRLGDALKVILGSPITTAVGLEAVWQLLVD